MRNILHLKDEEIQSKKVNLILHLTVGLQCNGLAFTTKDTKDFTKALKGVFDSIDPKGKKASRKIEIILADARGN
jgi:hypothetical protein